MYQLVKSFLDKVFAFILLFVGFLPMITLGMIHQLLNQQPLIFTQLRSGKKGRGFKLFKLCTMKHGKITVFGKFLRRWSIDEWPQLWNVVKGEMSLVGPRPLLPEYDLFYDHQQKKRLDVKPGITGLAQINGRNDISWEKRFEWDVYYVKHQSFLLDVKILIKTVVQLFDGKSADFHFSNFPKFSDQQRSK